MPTTVMAVHNYLISQESDLLVLFVFQSLKPRLHLCVGPVLFWSGLSSVGNRWEFHNPLSVASI